MGRRATIVSRIIRAGLPIGEVPEGMAKEHFLHIRFTQADKQRVEAAAKVDHLDMSTWARQMIMRAVEKVERAKGEAER